MGMYTSITHPINGREIQIKTGDDFLGWYHVGDKVDRHINKNDYGSGCCFDGAYDGMYDAEGSSYGDYKFKNCIVIIQDQHIKEVIDGDWKDDEEFYDEYHEYEKRYPTKIPHGEYTFKAYIKWLFEQAERKVQSIRRHFKNQKIRKNFIKQYGEEEGTQIYIGHILTEPIRRRLDYAGIFRKFGVVEEMPEGKPLIFDK